MCGIYCMKIGLRIIFIMIYSQHIYTIIINLHTHTVRTAQPIAFLRITPSFFTRPSIWSEVLSKPVKVGSRIMQMYSDHWEKMEKKMYKAPLYQSIPETQYHIALESYTIP